MAQLIKLNINGGCCQLDGFHLTDLLNFKSPSNCNRAYSHPLTSALPPPLPHPGSARGVLSTANVGSSGFTQSPMLTFQRTEPSANRPGHSRWLVEGGQAQEQGLRGGHGRTGKNRKIWGKMAFTTFQSGPAAHQTVTYSQISSAPYPVRNVPRFWSSQSFQCILEE